MILNECRENLKEFLMELQYNQNINYEKGLENRIDIEYVIERITNILEGFSLLFLLFYIVYITWLKVIDFKPLLFLTI